VFYVREGEGFPLVLVHMFGGNSWWFSRVLSEFAQSYDVVALDLPGCARSDTPPLMYDVPDMAEAVVQLLDTLELDRVHLATIGGGSLTAVQIATTRPERVGKLVLEALPHWTRREAKVLWRTLRDRWTDEHGNARPFEERGDLDGIFTSLDGPTRTLAIERMSTDFREHDRWWLGITVNALRYDVNPRLPAIAAPTLLVYGSAAMDFLRLREQQVVETIPSARLEIVPGPRTTSAFDRPDVYVPLVSSFLAEGAAATR
jgi:pimeloyl-ACP methyl ester carboxylesterase